MCLKTCLNLSRSRALRVRFDETREAKVEGLVLVSHQPSQALVSKPSGLLLIQFQESLHICSSPSSAVHLVRVRGEGDGEGEGEGEGEREVRVRARVEARLG